MKPEIIRDLKVLFLSGIALVLSIIFCTDGKSQSIPYLKKEGDRTQLIVDDMPFLMLAGELSNSASGSVEQMLGGDKPVPRKFYRMLLV